MRGSADQQLNVDQLLVVDQLRCFEARNWSNGPIYSGVSQGSNGVWLNWNSEPLSWLPTDHRPSCSAVSGTTVYVGSNARNIRMYKVQLSVSGA
jgi:hypothetical protein